MASNFFVGKIKNSKIFAELFDKKSLFQFIKYLITGLSSAGLDYLLYLLSKDVFELNPDISSAIGFSTIFWFSYLVNRFWSFRSKSDWKKQLFSYFILFFVNLVIFNFLLFNCINLLLHVNVNLTKLIIMSLIVPWNFIIYKKIIYRE